MKARPRTAGSNRGIAGMLQSRGNILIFFVLLPLLICLVLVLPPISLFSRITSLGYTSVAVKGTEIKNADGALLRIPEGAAPRGGAIKLSSTTLQTFAASPAAKALPAYLDVISPLYTIAVQGERPNSAELTLPLPADAEPYTTLDLWAQFGDNWFKVPFVVNPDSNQIESTLNFVPDSVVVTQTNAQPPLIAAMLTSRNEPPGQAVKLMAEVDPSGLRLADEGAIAGDVVALPETDASSPHAIVPTVSNSDENGLRTDLTQNMLSDETTREQHIRTLVDLAVQKLYSGYNIQYDGLTPDETDGFVAFVKELAKELHAQNKTLSVTLPVPKPVAQNEWDTGGYNWPLIGRYADTVKIPLLDASAYEGDSPLVDQYLQWATGQVDRYKLQVMFSVMGRDETATKSVPVSLSSALQILGPVSIPGEVRPGDQVTLELPKLKQAGGIQHHPPSGLFYFNYKDSQGAAHTVWLEDADSLAKKVSLLLKYNLKGIVLQDVDGKTAADPRIWDVLDKYRALEASEYDSKLTLVWVVDGNKVGTSSPDDPRFTWNVPDAAGQHTVDVALSIDAGDSFAPGGSNVAVNIEQATPTPQPTATQAPTKTPLPKPTKDPNAVVPTKAPAAPVAPKPVAGGNFAGRNMFGYGAQLNWTGSPIGTDGEMSTLQGMGFKWAKIQVRWCDLEGSKGAINFDSLDNIIGAAAAHGVQLMFSVMCGPGWTGAVSGCGGCNPGPPSDPNDLGDFLAAVSGRYCGRGLGAIEVWNEQNLRTEWGRNSIDPNDYLRYLRVAYPRIKQACSQVVVISGALTPTGGDGGSTAIEDLTYLRGMYAVGLKGVADAIGAHPNGFNNPPDVPAGWTNPANPGEGFKGHYSFYYRGVMENYRNVMAANGDTGKQIWATEFGWGVTGSPAPGYEFERDNTPDEQAAWLVKAYQMAKAWGWVGVMFTWNLDFNNSNADNRAFAILGTPAQAALTNMPK